MTQPTVEQLFARYRRLGDPDALAAVFDRTAPRLLGLAMHLVHDPHEAEDLVQATFLTAMEKAASFSEGRRLDPWLAGILHVHRRRLRRDGGRQPDPTRVQHGVASPPDQEYLRHELRAEVRRCVAELPASYRTVLMLKLVHGLAPAEIADSLGESPGAVRTRLHRGIEMLRTALPRGLAMGALASLLPGRGLAAVREQVLARAVMQPHWISPESTMMKNLFVGLGTAAIVTTAALVWNPLVSDTAATFDNATQHADGVTSQQEPAATTKMAGATGRVAVTDPGAPSLPAVTRAGHGELHVALHLDDPATPAAGVGVSLVEDDGRSMWLYARWERSSANGEVTFHDVAPGHYVLRMNRHGYVVHHMDAQFGGGIGVLDDVTESAANDVVEFAGEPAAGIASDVAMESGDYDRWHLASVAVEADSTTEIEVRVLPALTVDGIVVDPRGRPVAGARVWLAHLTSAPHPSRLEQTTDRDGHFEIEHLDRAHWIAARAPGYGPSRAFSPTQQDAAGGDRVTVRLVLTESGGTLNGRVIDPAGAPVANASVILGADLLDGDTEEDATGTWRDHAPPMHLRTDRRGRFTSRSLAVGTASVRVEADGLGSRIRTVEIAGPTASAIELQLGESWDVMGRVTAADGSVPWSSRILAKIDGKIIASVRPGADGDFRVDGLPPGNVMLVATAPSSLPSEVVLFGRAGDQLHQPFQLLPVAHIAGRVRAAGEPLRAWAVWAEAAGSADGPTTTVVSGDGSFLLATDPNRQYRLSLHPTFELQENGRSARPAPIPCDWLGLVAGDSDDVDIDVPATVRAFGFLEARILDAGGTPVRGIVNAMSGTRYVGYAALAADGTMQIGPLLPGAYDLWIDPSDDLAGDLILPSRQIAGARTADLGDIHLPVPGHLRVTLRSGASGVLICTVRDRSGRMVSQFAVAGSRPHAMALSPGEYDLLTVMRASGAVTPGERQHFSIRAGMQIDLQVGGTERAEKIR